VKQILENLDLQTKGKFGLSNKGKIWTCKQRRIMWFTFFTLQIRQARTPRPVLV